VLIATFDDQPITLDDTLMELFVSGRWEHVSRRLRLGVSLEVIGHEPGDHTQRAAEIAFRRRYRLLAADDLREWLDQRSISVSEWRDHIGRGVLADEFDDVAPPDLDGVEKLVAEHAFHALLLDGELAAARDRLLAAMAAHQLLDDDHDVATATGPSDDDIALARSAHDDPTLPLVSRDLDELARIVSTVNVLRAARVRADGSANARDVRELIAERRLDWTRVVVDDVVVGTASAAREVMLCVRDDGLALAEVAARAGTSVGHHECTAAEAGSVVAPLLLAATIGVPLGPVADGERWKVFVLRARHVPDDADPEVWARATEAVVADRLSRHLVGRVTHHADV
jgi:hypothetical protein